MLLMRLIKRFCSIAHISSQRYCLPMLRASKVCLCFFSFSFSFHTSYASCREGWRTLLLPTPEEGSIA